MRKIGILGASGRVGRLLVNLINSSEEATLSAAYFKGGLDFELPKSCMITNDIESFLNECETVIDFSSPEATEELLSVAIEKLPRALVIGTTGLDAHKMHMLQQASVKMPILYATNMSLGVALLNKLVEQASRALSDFDIEITEMHHRYKKDAPSGTALTLAQHAAQARGLGLDEVRVSGRNGIIGERSKNEIAVMALRGGDIVGEHTVGFYNDGEFVRLSHTATSRETFAKGAFRAALWLGQKEAGLYTITDCLGL